MMADLLSCEPRQGNKDVMLKGILDLSQSETSFPSLPLLKTLEKVTRRSVGSRLECLSLRFRTEQELSFPSLAVGLEGKAL